METELSQVIDESIQLELNIADLYTVFHKTFPDHANFWWGLILEEKNHAALVKSVRDHFKPVGKVPADLLAPKIKLLVETNHKIASLLKKYKDHPPSEKEAFNMAIDIEESAGEIHYQEFMAKNADSKLTEIFHQLNKNDKDHELKIRSYMANHVI